MKTTTAAERKALNWLVQRGVEPMSLKRMSGYTNHVFLVKQAHAPDSVLRLANHELGVGFCPLAHDTARVCAMHQQVAELGLAPRLLASDISAGIIWLEYAGEPYPVAQGNFAGLQAMLVRLHQSNLDWTNPVGLAVDGAGLAYLEQLTRAIDDAARPGMLPARHCAEQLYTLGVQRGYADYPLVPVHGDLNPGNCLYDKVRKRWFIIDWDFAGMRVAEWDYASLVVEHGWSIEQCRAFVPSTVAVADMIWFCAVFALLSWEWHFQWESGSAVIREKWQVAEYWFGLLSPFTSNG